MFGDEGYFKEGTPGGSSPAPVEHECNICKNQKLGVCVLTKKEEAIADAMRGALCDNPCIIEEDGSHTFFSNPDLYHAFMMGLRKSLDVGNT